MALALGPTWHPHETSRLVTAGWDGEIKLWHWAGPSRAGADAAGGGSRIGRGSTLFDICTRILPMSLSVTMIATMSWLMKIPCMFVKNRGRYFFILSRDKIIQDRWNHFYDTLYLPIYNKNSKLCLQCIGFYKLRNLDRVVCTYTYIPTSAVHIYLRMYGSP